LIPVIYALNITTDGHKYNNNPVLKTFYIFIVGGTIKLVLGLSSLQRNIPVTYPTLLAICRDLRPVALGEVERGTRWLCKYCIPLFSKRF